MMQEKIRKIQKEMNDYYLLLHNSEVEKDRIRYRGVIQGLEIALMILEERQNN